MHYPVRTALAAGIALVMFTAAPALAEVVTFKADLAGSNEVPPNDSKGTGTVDANLDTTNKTLTWTVDYSGLTGDAVAAHFHGPAAKGKNAPPVLPIDKSNLGSPIKGNKTLTDQQMQDLQDGKWYFNIHTAKYPDGEIRGQLTKQ